MLFFLFFLQIIDFKQKQVFNQMHVHKFKFEKTIMNQLDNKYCFDM